tara:strand:- start:2026 stop:2169 length:144 start_codon:yes stop_codon:yes gene_type:complete
MVKETNVLLVRLHQSVQTELEAAKSRRHHSLSNLDEDEEKDEDDASA